MRPLLPTIEVRPHFPESSSPQLAQNLSVFVNMTVTMTSMVGVCPCTPARSFLGLGSRQCTTADTRLPIIARSSYTASWIVYTRSERKHFMCAQRRARYGSVTQSGVREPQVLMPLPRVHGRRQLEHLTVQRSFGAKAKHTIISRTSKPHNTLPHSPA